MLNQIFSWWPDAANAGNAGIITLPPRLLLDNQ
jgi:hypothetical protein